MSAQETRWKRDGWEATVRIGVLTPHAVVTIWPPDDGVVKRAEKGGVCYE